MKELEALYKKYDVAEIAKKIGVSVPTVYKWKSGYSVPSPMAQRFIRGVYRDLVAKKEIVETSKQ